MCCKQTERRAEPNARTRNALYKAIARCRPVSELASRLLVGIKGVLQHPEHPCFLRLCHSCDLSQVVVEQGLYQYILCGITVSMVTNHSYVLLACISVTGVPHTIYWHTFSCSSLLYQATEWVCIYTCYNAVHVDPPLVLNPALV